MVTVPGPFGDVDAVRTANRNRGGHYFDPATLRFFGSRPGSRVYAGRFFVDGCQPPHGPRVFGIRVALDGGDVESVTAPPDGWQGERAGTAHPVDAFGDGNADLGAEWYTSRARAVGALRRILAAQGYALDGKGADRA